MESWLIYQKHTKLIQLAGFCSNIAFRTFLVFHKNLTLLCFPQEWEPFVGVRSQRVTGRGGQAHTRRPQLNVL